MKVVLASAILLTLASASNAASADDKTACLDASTDGQTLRNAHRLVEAREQLRICARRECPAAVQRDCGEWLEGVERSLPTVVLSAKDGGGSDLFDVTVTVDGSPLVNKLDGGALPMNPGAHTFRFELSDGRSATQQVLVREGEKAQGVAVVVAALQAPAPLALLAPSASGAETPRAPGAPAGPGPSRLVGAVASGVVGVGALATGIYFLTQVGSLVGERNQLCPDQNDCNNPTAYSDDHQARVDEAIGFVGLGVGVVGLGAATWLWLTASRGDAARPAASWNIRPMIAREGNGLQVGGQW